MLRTFLCFMLLLFVCTVSAQDAPSSDLIFSDTEITTQTDIFGLESPVLRGKITNQGSRAYTEITITVNALEAGGEIVGEGFGYVVDACGTALLDMALQPGQSFAFSASLELFEEDAEIATLDIRADATPVEPEALNLMLTFQGVTTVSGEEVVLVEWTDTNTLRYGVGCAGDVFTELDWYAYRLDSGQSTPITHPNAEQVTPALIQQLGLTQLTQGGEADEFVFRRSFLTFPVGVRRILYQSDLHTLYSAEPDGSFKRLIQDQLHRHSLQGLIWRPNGVFLAYYYGAYGESVLYLTATVEGQLLSVPPESATPSVIVPGPMEDGAFAVIGGTFDGVTGYYLKSTLYLDNLLLFEADLPGNNYPAPVYYRKVPDTRYVYVARPVNGQATLQCFHREANQLHTLTALPIQPDTDERAWSWVSPDYRKIAFSANGIHSGLWIVDLTAFEACQ